MNEKDINDRLKKILSPRRFRHVLSVSRWAEKLASIHGGNPAKARLAGLLHDCGKEIPGPLQLKWVRRWRLPVPDRDFIVRSGHWGLFHAYVSAALASRDYGMKDRGVLSAIRAHTLGAESMSLLDRILYVADFSAPQRSYPEAAKVRRAARKDLDHAFRKTLRYKLLDTLDQGGALHPLTVRLWNRWWRP